MKCCLFLCSMLLAVPSFAQQTVPDIPFDSIPNFLKLPPGMNLGEVPGVAVNSNGHLFVFTRSNVCLSEKSVSRTYVKRWSKVKQLNDIPMNSPSRPP